MLLSAGVLPRYEVYVGQCKGTLGLEPAAVRVEGGTGQSPGPVGAQPVLGALTGALLPAPSEKLQSALRFSIRAGQESVHYQWNIDSCVGSNNKFLVKKII